MIARFLSLKRLLAAALIGVSFWGLSLAFPFFIADLSAHPARAKLEVWGQDQRLPQPQEIEALLGRVETALRWVPGSSAYLELKGRLYYYRAMAENDRPVHTRAYLIASKHAYTRASEQRPQWPYNWASIVLIKAHLGELDATFDEALDRALSFGPWEGGVHIALTQAGLMRWSELSERQRVRVGEALSRGMVFNSAILLPMVEAFAERRQLCDYANHPLLQRQFSHESLICD